MKRAHRTIHALMWLILAPAFAVILAVSLMITPDEPINDALPEGLAAPAVEGERLTAQARPDGEGS